MRKRLALFLVKLARRLCPQKNFEYEPVQLGIGYQVTKQEVRKFRKAHEEYTSHRQGLNALIEDTKHVIMGNIAAGLVEKGLLKFKVKKSVFAATVEGKVIVYAPKEDQAEDTDA